MAYEKVMLVCQDSQEGIFTAVYDGWLRAVRGMEVEICTDEPENMILFCTCLSVSTDREKALKVSRTIQRRLGRYVYETICYAAASCCREKGTIILRVLILAMAGGRSDRRIMERLTDPYVQQAAKLRVRVWHELHRYYGFVRFTQKGKVLVSRIRPESDLLPLLAPHFADRYPGENWAIYDENRKKVLLHPADGICTIGSGLDFPCAAGDRPDLPEDYEDLWRSFCSSISIKERENPQLQRQFLPLKFRSNMTEFDKI